MIAMRHRGEKEIRINTHTQYDLTNESNENSDSDFIIIFFFGESLGISQVTGLGCVHKL